MITREQVRKVEQALARGAAQDLHEVVGFLWHEVTTAELVEPEPTPEPEPVVEPVTEPSLLEQRLARLEDLIVKYLSTKE